MKSFISIVKAPGLLAMLTLPLIGFGQNDLEYFRTFSCFGLAKGFSQDPLQIRDELIPVKIDNIKTVKRVVNIKSKPEEVFAFIDDIENMGMHMTKANAPMMGSKLTIEWLTQHKTGLGSKYRWRGKAMGMKMDFTVEVTKWIEGKEKTWETVGEAKMIVLSWYRMYLILTPLQKETTQAELGIYYTKPKGSFLGFLFARRYAVWCVKNMLKDSQKHFKNIHNEHTQ